MTDRTGPQVVERHSEAVSAINGNRTLNRFNRRIVAKLARSARVLREDANFQERYNP